MMIFVLTSCTNKKKYSEADVRTVLKRNNLPMPTCDLNSESRYREALRDYVLPAFQMYQGSFRYIRELVNNYRARGDEVKLSIISARYGLLDGNAPIVPYNCTFKGLSEERIRQRGDELKVYENLARFLDQNWFNQSVVILGKDYLRTVLDEKRDINFFRRIETNQLTVFASRTLKSKIPFPEKNLRFVAVSGIGDRNKKIKEFIARSRFQTALLPDQNRKRRDPNRGESFSQGACC